nr:MAG TPA: hypothetical protein [Caudoviricetes sp.]
MFLTGSPINKTCDLLSKDHLSIFPPFMLRWSFFC